MKYLIIAVLAYIVIIAPQIGFETYTSNRIANSDHDGHKQFQRTVFYMLPSLVHMKVEDEPGVDYVIDTMHISGSMKIYVCNEHDVSFLANYERGEIEFVAILHKFDNWIIKYIRDTYKA